MKAKKCSRATLITFANEFDMDNVFSEWEQNDAKALLKM